jgi:hypothetical protein
MVENLIIGCVTMAACLAVQCYVVAILLRVFIVLERKQLIRLTLSGSSWLLITVLLIILAGNLVQVAVWAGLFFACGEFADFATAFYHSAVNFSTLGYGDLVMSEQRRLLGALEAANGVLMFGLTTGVLYTVLNALMRRAWERRPGRDGESRQVAPS